MVEPLQYRILPNNGFGWYWEVIHDREVIARGVADAHARARADAEKASLAGSITRKACRRGGAILITAARCKTYARECRRLGTATDISVQRVTVLMAMSRSWTALANQKERLDDIVTSEGLRPPASVGAVLAGGVTGLF
jgi:hypothetical protein